MGDIFNYEYHSNFDEAQAEKLEDMPETERIASILMTVHSIRKGILTQEEGLQAIHNDTISLLVA